MIQKILKSSLMMSFILMPLLVFAESHSDGFSIGGVRVEFLLFGITLLSVAIFHNHTYWVGITGLIVILLYKLLFTSGYPFYEHFLGNNAFLDQIKDKHLRQGEWSVLLNLMGLLLGFGMLAKVFEESGVPDKLPKFLPSGWKGAALLLVFVFILSSFLDNIAAAMIGGTVALVVFKNKVHIGYIAAIVAASNAGGSGSIVGDTTTTMMWIDGVDALNVLHAYVAAIVALVIVAWFASHQQDKYQPISSEIASATKIDWGSIGVVVLILAGAILSNVYYDMPALGVWVAILVGAMFRKMPWHEVNDSLKGTIFLLCLVTAASLMPVETLPNASWLTAFILGCVSAVFDNIPLTKLCLEQGHYDWGMLAYSVGFGGSMIWFGSSAGVAITNKFTEARNVTTWIQKGWHVIVAYVLGFFVLFLTMGWEPADNKKHKEPAASCPVEDCKAKIDASTLE